MSYRVVVNKCFGGFSLSEEGIRYMREHGIECDEYSLKHDFPRHHPVLVGMVKDLGSESASGFCANLVVEKLDLPLYLITEYDGYEEVITPDMCWEDARNIE